MITIEVVGTDKYFTKYLIYPLWVNASLKLHNTYVINILCNFAYMCWF